MNIKEKIKEVNDYFVEKLLKGEYSVELIDRYTILVKIDGEYVFSIWSVNYIENLETYNNGSFMLLSFTYEQKEILYKVFNKYVKDFIREEELKMLNELKLKYND